MDANHLLRLMGRNVLVRSTADYSDPPIALRGTVDAADAGGEPVVKIVLEFPDMCNRAAHRRTFPLDQREIDELLAQPEGETLNFTTHRPLDPEAGFNPAQDLV